MHTIRRFQLPGDFIRLMSLKGSYSVTEWFQPFRQKFQRFEFPQASSNGTVFHMLLLEINFVKTALPFASEPEIFEFWCNEVAPKMYVCLVCLNFYWKRRKGLFGSHNSLSRFRPRCDTLMNSFFEKFILCTCLSAHHFEKAKGKFA